MAELGKVTSVLLWDLRSVIRVREMAQSVRCLLKKCENPNLSPLSYERKARHVRMQL